MSRFLMVSWNGGGNTPPMFELAAHLRDRGHEVSFCGTELAEAGSGYATLEMRCKARKFRFQQLPRSTARFARDRGGPGILTGVMASEEHVADLQDLNLADDVLVVVDGLMFGAITALEARRFRTAIFIPGAPGAFAGEGVPFEGFLSDGVNEFRRGQGLPELERLGDAWSGLPALCESIPDLDPHYDQFSSSVEYVGPIFEAQPLSGWTPPWGDDDTRPVILVSFTTNPAWDQTSRIRRTIDALADGGYRVVVTASLADISSVDLPESVVVERHIPHAEVLPLAAAAVGHAGHGTIAMPLAHGVPLVSLPNPVADQPPLALRVQELGAGIALDGETATPAEICAAVEEVVTQASYRTSAQRLARSIAATGGAAAAADMVERLASAAPRVDGAG
jgi:UDP:flavonoid glycosyltransferase YjiC (YdhE family)